MKKVDELLAEATNPAIKEFLKGFKDVVDLVDPICNGENVSPADLPEAKTGAQAKGRELAASLLGHFIY